MKIKEVIDAARRLRPGCVFSERDAVEWLKTLDGIIQIEIIDTHTGNDVVCDINKYNASTELIVPNQYSDLYVSYLCAQIDRTNNETTRFNNEMTLFETAYSRFAAYYNRTHMPKEHKIRW